MLFVKRYLVDINGSTNSGTSLRKVKTTKLVPSHSLCKFNSINEHNHLLFACSYHKDRNGDP